MFHEQKQPTQSIFKQHEEIQNMKNIIETKKEHLVNQILYLTDKFERVWLEVQDLTLLMVIHENIMTEIDSSVNSFYAKKDRDNFHEEEVARIEK